MTGADVKLLLAGWKRKRFGGFLFCSAFTVKQKYYGSGLVGHLSF
jgi:hypothetical protein